MTNPLKTRVTNRSIKYRTEYDVGALVKSPCKECDGRPHFPGCIDSCAVLARIHDLLAETISCTRRR